MHCTERFMFNLVAFQRIQVVWCGLIYEVIEPVDVEHVAVGFPAYNRWIVRVVILVVIYRWFDRKSCVDVTAVFCVQSHRVIF